MSLVLRLWFGSMLLAVAGCTTASGGNLLCTVHEVSSHRLMDDSVYVYVEPTAASVSGAQTLLAGTPTYVTRNAHGGRAARVTRDSLFGLVVTEGGRITGVPRPGGGVDPVGIRLAAHSSGEWHVVWGEADSATTGEPESARRVIRLWHGTVGQSGWRVQNVIHAPPNTGFLPFESSTLLAVGDTLWWAVKVVRADTADDVALITHRAGRWSYEHIDVSRPAYVQLGYVPGEGVRLFVVTADPAAASDANSLFVYSGQQQNGSPVHHVLQKLIPGGTAPVHNPYFADGLLHWRVVRSGENASGSTAYAAAVGPGTTLEDPAIIDSAAAQFRYVGRNRNSHVWLSHHTPPTGESELRVIAAEVSLGRTELLDARRYPFDGPFHAVAIRDNEILVTGPKIELVEGGGILATVLLRLAIECAN